MHGACVAGSPGSGKSALFSKMVRILGKEGMFVLVHAAGISSRASQVDTLLRRWIGELARQLKLEDPSAGIEKREDLEKTFAELLSRAAAAQRVVCLIDALNQFERTISARHLTWLPKSWPGNARLIAFAIPGTETEALKNRSRLEIVPLPLLYEIESREIAHTVCRRYHKTINLEVLGILLAERLPDGSPSAGNPLWLELALEELLLLDADDFGRMDKDFVGTPEQKLLGLLKDVASALPPDIESLYAFMLQRSEDVYGEKLARNFACLTAISRTGLREQDLRALLPETTGEPWDDLRFAALRRGFRAHLVQRGAHGQWDFTHAQIRIAIRRRSLADKAFVRSLHTSIANHLLGLQPDDDLRAGETMHHLAEANDPQRAALYYSGLSAPLGLPNPATQTLSDRILASEDLEATAEVAWTASLLEQPGLQPGQIAALCNRFQFDLDEPLKKKAVWDHGAVCWKRQELPVSALRPLILQTRAGSGIYL